MFDRDGNPTDDADRMVGGCDTFGPGDDHDPMYSDDPCGLPACGRQCYYDSHAREWVNFGCTGCHECEPDEYDAPTATDETPAELVACDCCGGTGRVAGPTRDNYGTREDYPAEVECPHCGGTGVQAV
jgi:hypothetical protein